MWSARLYQRCRHGGRAAGRDRGGAGEHAPPRPDDTGVESFDSDVVFGHKRLSIIDVELSHEPIPYPPSGPEVARYLLTFNGEIYNYIELRQRADRRVRRRVRHARATPRWSSPATTTGARRCWTGCAGCSRSSSGTAPERHGVRRPRPVRHQAAALPAYTGRRRLLRQREEGAAAVRAVGAPGRRRPRHGQPVALPDAAVRAGAGHPALRHQPDRVGRVPHLHARAPR